MKKIFKGLLYFLAGLLLIIITALILPLFFKDEIKAAVDTELEKAVNAKIVYDLDKFGLTMLKDFPNLTVQIEDFGVINNAPFDGDTLAMIGEFGVSLDISSVISGDQMEIQKIYVADPVFKILVNEDSIANYDIAKGETEEEETLEDTTTSEPFLLNLNHWEITNAKIVYDDRPTNTRVELKDFNHYGNGKIAAVYDLNLQTSIDEINVNLEGAQYYTKSKFDSDITLNLDLTNGKYTFLDNSLSFNQFMFGFDGWLEMIDEDINMDITFGAKETSFKNILSIVPGMFMADFDDIKTSGSLAFDGFAKGTYNDKSMPGFLLNLKVNDAMFQYPDLPTAINDIALDLKVDNTDGNMDNIEVAVNKFHMKLGSNPIDFNMLMHVLRTEDYDIKKANLDAKLNLAEISSFYPVDGFELQGIFGMDAHIQGLYSEKKNSIPVVSSKLSLANGLVKSEEYNVTAEDMSCNAWVQYKNNLSPEDTIMKVDHFGLTLDGERFGSELAVWNLVMADSLEEVEWNFSMNGLLNLEKLMKLAPIEGTTLKGIIDVDHVTSKGKYSDVAAENYSALETHGKATISNLEYFEEELLPQGFKITKSEIEVDPQNVILKSFDGFIGKSDMQMTGKLSNYMGYTDDLMKDKITPHGTLKGNLNYYTSTFYTSEWLDTTEVAETESVAVEDTVTGDITDYAVPKNIYFVMDAKIDKILYDNMEIKSAKGDLIIKNGIVDMSNLSMYILGGKFAMDGKYNTANPQKPKFDMNMSVDKLSFKESYEVFNTVKTLAPAAKNIEGTFSSDMSFRGPLDAELMPIYDKLNGTADFLIKNAKMKDLKFVEKITEATKLYNTDELKIENTLIKTKIINGKTYVEEFPAQAGEAKFKIKGNRTLDGIIDFDIEVDMPAGKAGNALNNVLASHGINDVVGDRFIMPLKVTGEETNPKVKVLGVKQGGKKPTQSVAASVVKSELVQEKKEEQKKEILAEAEKRAAQIRAESKRSGKRVKDEAYKQAKDIENKASKPWEKAGAKVASDKLKKEGANKEKQIIQEGNKKADKLLKEARERANKL